MDRTDQQLLWDYLEARSEAAFAELVRRYVDLVYCVACRITADAHTAEDVTQATFLVLARSASRLKERSVLAGWLHHTARNLAVKTVRADVRRRAREQQIALTNENDSIMQKDGWKDTAALLDSGLEELSDSDRDAVLLRFFHGKSSQEIGVLLGISEVAAQKRVSRAIERLRRCLARRGIPVSAGILAATVSTNAIQAAPAGLASTITTSAALVEKSILTSQLLQATTMTIRTKHFASALIVTLLISTAYLCHRNSALRHQLGLMRASAAALTQSSDGGAFDLEPRITTEEWQRLRKEHLELLTMRGRVAQLSKELREQARRDEGSHVEPADQSLEEDSILFSATVTNHVPPGTAIVVGGWHHGEMRGYLVLTPGIARDDAVPEDERLQVKSVVIAAPESFWTQIGWGDAESGSRRSTLSGLFTSAQVDSLLQTLKETKGAEISNESVAKGGDGERLGIGFSVAGDKESGVLMAVDVYPRIGADAQSVDVEIYPSAVPANTPVHPSLTRARETNR